MIKYRNLNFWDRNGLSIVVLSLAAIFLIGLSIAGMHNYNNKQEEHGQTPVSYAQYLAKGDFWEAIMENWESAFLQISSLVLLSVFLRQKGSPESKKLHKREKVDKSAEEARKKLDTPAPEQRGGFIRWLYENSLSLVTGILFVIFFLLHAVSGAAAYNEEQLPHGGETVTALEFIKTSQFWFQSFQNWQSEYFSVGALTLFTIFLRQKGSPQSKPVYESNEKTGRS